MLIRVYNSTKDEDLDKVSDVHVHVDGREMVVPAGTQVRLTPGESISIYPYMYHDFRGGRGQRPGSLSEVSQCNDDNVDTVSMRRWEDSRRSRRMKHRIVCCATNIRRQNR